ncbi:MULTISPECIES: hypothetical protein [unclassified Caballeronia]|uniref:hypothetical protein n=1 Tax=unclassified Caballeronia TaxID=2646786 RepID=UPI002029847A|nr:MULTISPECIES: hypothetical protein [unclassified Caballeronia]
MNGAQKTFYLNRRTGRVHLGAGALIAPPKLLNVRVTVVERPMTIAAIILRAQLEYFDIQVRETMRVASIGFRTPG